MACVVASLVVGPTAVTGSTVCKAGSVLDADGFCVPCPQGSIPDGAAQNCSSCPAGHFSDRIGRTVCEACASGRYTPIRGRPFCNMCPLGGVCKGSSKNNGSATEFFTTAKEYFMLGDQATMLTKFAEQVSDRGWDPYNTTGFNAIGPFRCRSPESCLGNNTCKHGSEGVLCGTCSIGYQRIHSEDPCAKCPGPFQNVGTSLLALTFLYIVVVLIDRRHLMRMGDPKEVSAVVPKIMASFFVLLSVVSRNIGFLDLLQQIGDSNPANWVWIGPMYLALFVGNALESPARTVFSIKCFGEHWAGTDVRGVMVVLAWLFLPILLFLHMVVIVIVNVAIHARANHGCAFNVWDRRMVASSIISNFSTVGVVLIYFVHPMIASQFLPLFDCQDFDPGTSLFYDTPRLVLNQEIDCGSERHITLQLAAGLGIVLWGFGIPAAFFLRLYHQQHYRKEPVTEPNVWRLLGFLMDGYEPKYYYYETIFMTRKVLFPLGANLPWVTNDTRTMLLLGMALGFLGLHLSQQPFDNRAYLGLDKLETTATFSLIFLLLGRLVNITLAGSRFSDTETVGHMAFLPAIVGFFSVCTYGLYLGLRCFIWPAGKPSPVLPDKICQMLDGRAYLTIVPPLEEETKSLMAREHVALGQRVSGSDLRTLPEREHAQFGVLLGEIGAVVLRRHELCLGEAPELIYLPSLVMQIERIMISCMCMALKTRVAQARRDESVALLQSRFQRGAATVKVFAADMVKGRDRHRELRSCSTMKRGEKETNWASCETLEHEHELLKKPVSVEEVHLALNTLLAHLLDPDQDRGVDFLPEFIRMHRGLLDMHSNASTMFNPREHEQRIQNSRKFKLDTPGSYAVPTYATQDSGESMFGHVHSCREDSSDMEIRVTACVESSDEPRSPNMRLPGEANDVGISDGVWLEAKREHETACAERRKAEELLREAQVARAEAARDRAAAEAALSQAQAERSRSEELLRLCDEARLQARPAR
eukprot:TRINITY_DN21210_c0_g1_i2.p1 TRINITY_DN21210_c0_g1~~TRINITY_DN21210_c0_g1_i2.p1  ORF type:complete len:1023 (-),score=159.46 TRINITY_DN21210_c0_g1_i2:73-3030(-)